MHVRARAVGSLLAAVAIVMAIAAGGVVTAQPPWSARIDDVFGKWSGRTSPGCAVGIYRDGQILFERGYGIADLEHDVPIAADTVFYVGSLSKQFTAFAAALAIKDGRLSPDDSIRKYLPELPSYADAIKVRHLVHHTSGLRDYNTLLAIAGRRGDEAYDNATVLRITARQKQLNFSPGAEYLYSNTGYTLLATVVERATGTPFAAFADARIFKPLGMESTHYHVDAGRLVKNRAYAYAGSSGAWRLDTPNNERAGAGGLYTTCAISCDGTRTSTHRRWVTAISSRGSRHRGGSTTARDCRTRGGCKSGATAGRRSSSTVARSGDTALIS